MKREIFKVHFFLLIVMYLFNERMNQFFHSACLSSLSTKNNLGDKVKRDAKSSCYENLLKPVSVCSLNHEPTEPKQLRQKGVREKWPVAKPYKDIHSFPCWWDQGGQK